jgi:hypothetical protein
MANPVSVSSLGTTFRFDCRDFWATFIGREEVGRSCGAATIVVAGKRMRPREELEQFVQLVGRKHPVWTARLIEKELESLAPVLYANWRDETPDPRARLRQVQRWRKGDRSPHRPVATNLFRYVWIVGERQRQELEPEFSGRPTQLRASQRLFIHNCSTKVIQEVHVHLKGKEVAYEPAVQPGKFAEIGWFRNETIRSDLLAAVSHDRIPYSLTVEFAIDEGRRRGNLSGTAVLDASDGWVSFSSSDGQAGDLM